MDSASATAMLTSLTTLGAVTGSAPPTAATHRLPAMATTPALSRSSQARRRRPEDQRARTADPSAAKSPATSRPAELAASRVATSRAGSSRRTDPIATTRATGRAAPRQSLCRLSGGELAMGRR